MKTTACMAIAVLVASGSLAGCGKPVRMAEKAPTLVKAQIVETFPATGGARYSASIIPRTQVDVAFKVGGYVEKIHQVRGADGVSRNAQEGDWAGKGTILAQVRQQDYNVKVNHANGQLAEARSSLVTSKNQLAEAEVGAAKAKLDFERAQALFARDSLTKPDYDLAKSQLDLAQAKVETAKSQVVILEAKINTAEAALAEAKIAKEDTVLISPMSGTLLQRSVEVGTLVSPGKAGFVLADTSSVKAAFGVPDLELQNLKMGSSLAITVEALPNREFKGQLTSIAPSADPKTRLFEIEVTIPNSQSMLKPGMIASLTLAPRSTKVVLVVPLSAITRSKDKPDQYGLFVVEERGGKQSARLRTVTLGEAYGNRVAVISGVRTGERVIITGTSQLVDGEQVQIMP